VVVVILNNGFIVSNIAMAEQYQLLFGSWISGMY